PDLVLKLHSVDPANAILDRDGDGQLKVRLRFNKAIDQYAGNAQYFYVTGPNGQLLPTRTDIVNNDAIIYLEEPVKLVSGDALRVVVEAGLAATKAVEQSGGPAHLTLYKLRSEQRIDLTYRGSRPYSIAIDSVVPRRIPAEQAHPITLSMLGVPLAPERVKLFVGGQALAIGSLKRSEQDSSIAIIEAQVPALQAAGLYDLTAQVEFDGVWEEASLYGALQVDAPVRFTRIEPQWGPLSGGTKVTIHGEGFEPGNTVMDGLTVLFGSSPANNIEVLSSTRLTLVTPRGTPGLKRVQGKDRYGRMTELAEADGFGYGLRQLAVTQAAQARPVDVIVDQETGVALTATGYFHETFNLEKLMSQGPIVDGVPIPESLLAASFDVQEAVSPLLVGGVGSLPSGERGAADLKRHATYQKLSSKALLNEVMIDFPA